ncbi:MAG: hypothetical protein Q7W45_13265 [Bacteroidota bacterium]|nr:hypothetical protein [Bacteroidota bacterium]MDP3144510.1 hypothetical protein [Bacteroidota bacterium]
MKKIIILALFAFVVINSSCRKTRTCECVTKYTTQFTTGNSTNTTSGSSFYKITKDKQKKGDFRKMQNCYGTKSTNTTTSGNATTVTMSETSCQVK